MMEHGDQHPGERSQVLFRGKWWLPATPEICSAGSLWATDSGLELRLDDALFAAGWGDMREHDAVHGDVRPSAASGVSFPGPITLFDAFDTHTRPGRTTHASHRVFANMAVYGAHYLGFKDCMVSGMSMEADALDAWLPYSHSFRRLVVREQGGMPDPKEAPKCVTFSLDGASGGLHLAHSRQVSDERRTYALSEHATASWCISPHIDAATAFARFVQPLHRLLTICYAAPVPIRRLTATRAEGGQLGKGLTFYSARIEGGTMSLHGEGRKRFRYAAIPIGDDPEPTGRLIERWYALVEKGERRRGVEVLAGTLGHPGLYVENRLLGVVAAAEAIHRAQHGNYDASQRGHGRRARRACDAAPEELRPWLAAMLRTKPRHSLRDRLRKLLEANADGVRADWFGDVDAFTRRVSAARDAIAHGLDYSATQMQRSAGMLPIVYQVVVLLTAELLRLLEVDTGSRASWIANSEAARNVAHFLSKT